MEIVFPIDCDCINRHSFVHVITRALQLQEEIPAVAKCPVVMPIPLNTVEGIVVEQPNRSLLTLFLMLI